MAGLLLMAACGKPVEGCLDVRASNFRADADEDCCCVWPAFQLSVGHFVGDDVHVPSLYYQNEQGDDFRLLETVLLLSDFQLHFRQKAPVALLDSMRVQPPVGTGFWWRRDQWIIDRDQSRIRVGAFIGDGQLDSVSFLLGLPTALSQTPPTAFPENHPLLQNKYTLWDPAEGYAAVLARFINGAGDTLTWTLRDTLRVRIPKDQFLITGEGLDIPLRIDYGQWFARQGLSGPDAQPDQFWPEQVRQSLE